MRSGKIQLFIGTPSHGLWCADCNLPSQMEVPVNAVTNVGVTTVGTYSVCSGHHLNGKGEPT